MAKHITRVDIEDYLFYEAKLLDEWRLMEWTGLFTKDAVYEIPPLGHPDAESDSNLFFVSDDYDRLVARAERLLKKEAHVEYPHSTVSRMLSNVRIDKLEDDFIYTECNFMLHRTKREVLDSFVGRIKYKLVERNGELKIAGKRVILTLDSLRPHGKVSIIF